MMMGPSPLFAASSFSLIIPFLLLFTFSPCPPLLAYDLASVLDNSIIGTPKVVCEESEVALDILTAKPFIGNIFVKGRAKDASCRQSFGDPGKNETSIYTLSLGKCGMQRLRSANPRGISFAVTVVVSFHPAGFITKNDRAYHLSCFYTEPEEIVTSSFEVSHIPAQELSDHMSLPNCRYSVHANSVDGPQLSWANVGDTVYHVWECKGPELGILVKKCFVTDGDGEDHAVVDEEGCSLDLGLLNEIVYTDDGTMRAHAKSQVFKYADSNQLFFTCQIRMCQKQLDLCRGITPPKCDGKREDGKEKKKGGKGAKGKGEKEKGKLDKLLEEFEVEVEGADWSLDEAKKEVEEKEEEKKKGKEEEEKKKGKEDGKGGNVTVKMEEERRNETMMEKGKDGRKNETKMTGWIAEKEEEEEEEKGAIKGRGRRALLAPHPQMGAGHLEVDVASPQMLVLDREDQIQIGKSAAEETMRRNSAKGGRQMMTTTTRGVTMEEGEEEGRICVAKDQLLAGLTLAMALLAGMASLLTLLLGHLLLKWKKRKGAMAGARNEDGCKCKMVKEEEPGQWPSSGLL